MNSTPEYFPEADEWSVQERQFANRVIDEVGLAAWHELLHILRKDGNEAFLQAISQKLPNGLPPN